MYEVYAYGKDFVNGKAKLHLTFKYSSILTVFIAMFAVVCHGQIIHISEVVTDNGNSLLDEDADSPDWIELHNSSDQSVSIDGWYLTDDPADLTKWSFPATTISAKGFLLVFASDKNQSVAGSELHTNFKLSAAGEYLALVQSDGSTVEDSHTLSALDRDVSWGHAFTAGEINPTETGLLSSSNSGIREHKYSVCGICRNTNHFPPTRLLRCTVSGNRLQRDRWRKRVLYP